MVVGLLSVVIFPYIHIVNPAAQIAIITPKTTPQPELKTFTPSRNNMPKKIKTVAGTVAKKPGLYTSTRRRRAPLIISSHPRSIPTRSTIINDQNKRIKSYGVRSKKRRSRLLGS
jgi:hypothetical protein